MDINRLPTLGVSRIELLNWWRRCHGVGGLSGSRRALDYRKARDQRRDQG
jgi:hypothetical protein